MNRLRRYTALGAAVVLTSMLLVVGGGVNVVVHLCRTTGTQQLGLWQSPHEHTGSEACHAHLQQPEAVAEHTPACCQLKHTEHSHAATDDCADSTPQHTCPCCVEDYALLKLADYESQTHGPLLVWLTVPHQPIGVFADEPFALAMLFEPLPEPSPPDDTEPNGRDVIVAAQNFRI